MLGVAPSSRTTRPRDVDLEFRCAGRAAQLLVERFLDARPAGAKSGKPHDGIEIDLPLAGHADIAHHMRHGPSMIIFAVG